MSGIRGNQGASLATVILVMTVIAISLTVFLRQTGSTLPSFKNRRDQLQSLANSRSSALKGMVSSRDNSEPDTSAINEPLFEEDDVESLWKDSLYGDGTFTVDITPFAQKITAEGTKREKSSTVIAEVASSCVPYDTVLMLFGKSILEAGGISGTKAVFDSSGNTQGLPLNRMGMGQAKEWLAKQFEDLSSEIEAPKNIREQKDFGELSDTVNGPLFLDAPIGSLLLTGGERTIRVNGDLQLTGEVAVNGVSFIVAGEVRLNDRSSIKNGDLFVNKKVFFADETSFTGRVVSLDRVEIFGSAKVNNESLIISFAGKKKKKDSKPTSSSNSESENKSPAGAINIREQATLSGTCVALGSEGVMTESSAQTTGILWSDSWIRHFGLHKGLLRAPLYLGEVGMEAPGELPAEGNKNAGVTQPKQQQVPGSVERPFEKIVYPLPWFIGNPRMNRWSES